MSDDIHWKEDEFADIKYDDLDSLERVVQRARQAEKDGEWKNFSVETEEDYGSYRVILRGYRHETAREKERRLEEEARAKQVREEFERRQYEALKAKYEKDTK